MEAAPWLVAAQRGAVVADPAGAVPADAGAPVGRHALHDPAAHAAPDGHAPAGAPGAVGGPRRGPRVRAGVAPIVRARARRRPHHDPVAASLTQRASLNV